LNAEAVDSYYIKYQVDGDKLVVWPIDEKAKLQATKDSTIKGVIDKDKPAKFIDATENVARFVIETGDSLFSKEPLRLERVTLLIHEGLLLQRRRYDRWETISRWIRMASSGINATIGGAAPKVRKVNDRSHHQGKAAVQERLPRFKVM
jgi:hypothetical protein